MGALLGQKKEYSDLGMVAPQQLRHEINRAGSGITNPRSGSRTIHKRPKPIKQPAKINRSDSSQKGSGQMSPDLPGHGLPDKKEPRQVQITSEPNNSKSDQNSNGTEPAQTKSNSNDEQKTEQASPVTPAPTKQANIIQQLQSVDKKVWYGLGGGLVFVLLISTLNN